MRAIVTFAVLSLLFFVCLCYEPPKANAHFLETFQNGLTRWTVIKKDKYEGFVPSFSPHFHNILSA